MKYNELFSIRVVNTCDQTVPPKAISYLIKHYGKGRWCDWYVGDGFHISKEAECVDDWLLSIGATKHEYIIILVDW